MRPRPLPRPRDLRDTSRTFYIASASMPPRLRACVHVCLRVHVNYMFKL